MPCCRGQGLSRLELDPRVVGEQARGWKKRHDWPAVIVPVRGYVRADTECGLGEPLLGIRILMR